MWFNNIFLNTTQVFPINTNDQVCNFYLPANRLGMRQLASLTIIRTFAFKNIGLQKLEANGTSAISIKQIKFIGKIRSRQIFLEL